MIGNFFKQRSHYVFNYKPRFYDPRKERIEALKKKYSDEKKNKNSVNRTPVNFREAWKKNKKKSDNKATLRVAIIITILIFLVYKYFKYIGISFF